MLRFALLDRALDVKKLKLRTLFQRATRECKEVAMPPVRDISGQVAIFILGGADNSNHMSINSEHMISNSDCVGLHHLSGIAISHERQFFHHAQGVAQRA